MPLPRWKAFVVLLFIFPKVLVEVFEASKTFVLVAATEKASEQNFGVGISGFSASGGSDKSEGPVMFS